MKLFHFNKYFTTKFFLLKILYTIELYVNDSGYYIRIRDNDMNKFKFWNWMIFNNSILCYKRFIRKIIESNLHLIYLVLIIWKEGYLDKLINIFDNFESKLSSNSDC